MWGDGACSFNLAFRHLPQLQLIWHVRLVAYGTCCFTFLLHMQISWPFLYQRECKVFMVLEAQKMLRNVVLQVLFSTFPEIKFFFSFYTFCLKAPANDIKASLGKPALICRPSYYWFYKDRTSDDLKHKVVISFSNLNELWTKTTVRWQRFLETLHISQELQLKS